MMRIGVDKYPGVFYRTVKRVGRTGTEKMYYVTYKEGGQKIEAKAGRQSKGWSPARASAYRARLIEGKELSPQAKRAAEQAAKKAEEGRYTVAKLWVTYKAANPNLKGWKTGTYDSLYNKHVEPRFADKEPGQILPLDVKRVQNQMLKTYSPQLVKHALKMLRTLCNFGANNNLCDGLNFTIKMPTVDNTKTENLTPEQMHSLLEAIKNDDHLQAGSMMLMALYSGMRRGELFRLKWSDVDFERGFIQLVNPKGGKSKTIPLNDAAKALLEKHPRTSEFVFPGRGGEQRTRIDKAVRKIKADAGLPEGFRGLHGLRHVFASTLANSGVDLFTIGKLLTHKDPTMTVRYAHLGDQTLKNASNLAGELLKVKKNNNVKTA